MTEDTRKDDEERAAADAGDDADANPPSRDDDGASEGDRADATGQSAATDADRTDRNEQAAAAGARPSRVPLLLAVLAALAALLALAGVATLWLADRGPDALALDNSSMLQHLQMLGDRLARQVEVVGQRGYRVFPPVTEA